MSGHFDRLIAAWRDLKAANRDMLAGPVPAWPWDRTSPDFAENLRLRDRTQGLGMRFAAIWREHADDVIALVETSADVFSRYHVADKRGELIDPTLYMESMTVMPLLISLRHPEEAA
jgi:hypothetical protein